MKDNEAVIVGVAIAIALGDGVPACCGVPTVWGQGPFTFAGPALVGATACCACEGLEGYHSKEVRRPRCGHNTREYPPSNPHPEEWDHMT